MVYGPPVVAPDNQHGQRDDVCIQCQHGGPEQNLLPSQDHGSALMVLGNLLRWSMIGSLAQGLKTP